jgi:two-component system, OmpR family, response regulator RpaA
MRKFEQARREQGLAKRVFSTGEVAKVCRVAPRTVSKWFDAGLLKGYLFPGTRERRIPREQLVRFLQENGMSPDGLAAFDQAE